jgi:glycosyltransferase involved in cell wall biosynthesis
MNKLISIAMATYNGAKYLEEQLDSIYTQTYKEFEVIVIDDLSTDATVLILEKYKQKFGLKYFVNDVNMGVTKNFEKAILKCNGEYIALVDQDDIWLQNKLEVLYENIGNSSLIYSNAGIINGNGEIQNKTTRDIYPLYGVDSQTPDIYNYIVLNSFILGCSTMFKRELLSTLVPIYQSTRNHDWWLTMCAHNTKGIKYIDEVLFYYRHHSNNYSRQGKEYSFFQKIFEFYSDQRIISRRNKITEQCMIIDYLLTQDCYITEYNKDFLKDMKLFCYSFLHKKIHFKAFLISIKYKTYIFPGKDKIENMFHIISRITG